MCLYGGCSGISSPYSKEEEEKRKGRAALTMIPLAAGSLGLGEHNALGVQSSPARSAAVVDVFEQHLKSVCCNSPTQVCIDGC